MAGVCGPAFWRARSVPRRRRQVHIAAMRFQYQAPDTHMTLREGLQELQANIPDFIDGGKDYQDHDILHVLYGLDTSLDSEGLLDVLTLFGTDCSFATYRDLIGRPESKELIRNIGYLRVGWWLLTRWPVLIAAIFRARSQTKRWPYDDYESRMDTALPTLRAEFGIRVRARV